MGLSTSEIAKAQKGIAQLQGAISRAFNPKIGTLDLTKFNQILSQEHISLNSISSDWSKMGAQGKATINSLTTAMTTLQKQTISANSVLSKMATTMGNTVRWGITASLFQEMMSSISSSVRYMKDLDESLTQIQMVSQASAQNMRDLAQYANKAAQGLATTTVDYTNAIKVFTQEGFSLPESKLQSELAIKLSNVSEQNSATTADQITAYRNAFGLSIDEMSQSLDKLANVANNTASNVGELMTAAQRSASVASAVGASEDTFLASVATIQSVTRQSAEEIGNGMKTIMQRFADIKTSGKTDDGIAEGEYAQALDSIGVKVRDAQGEFRGFDAILHDLQDTWKGLSETQKVAVGEKVAGKFQYNRFAALMNNQEYYDKAIGATQDAGGMMDAMQEEYASSIEGRMKTLKAAGEQVISTLFDQDKIEPVLEDVTELVNGLNELIEVAGGAQPIFSGLSAIMLKAFSPQIGEQVDKIATSIQMSSAIKNSNKNLQSTYDKLGINVDADKTTETSKFAQQVMPQFGSVGVESQKAISNTIQQLGDIETEFARAQENKNDAFRAIKNTYNDNGISSLDLLGTMSDRVESNKEERDAIKTASNIKGRGEEDVKRAKEFNRQKIDDLSLQESSPAVEKEIQSRKNLLLLLEQEDDWLKKAYQDYQAKIDLEEKEIPLFTEITAKLSQGQELTEEELQLLQKWVPELKGVVQQYDKASAAATELEGKMEAAKNSAQGLKSSLNTQAIGKGFSKLGSAAMSGVFAIQSLDSMMKILEDDSLTMKEKIDKSLMSIVMLGSMGVSAFTSIGSAMTSFNAGLASVGGISQAAEEFKLASAEQAVVKATDEKTAALARYRAAMLQNNVAQSASTLEEKANAKASFDAAKAKKANAIAARDEAKSNVKSTASGQANTASKMAGAIATKIAAAATTEGTIANGLYSISLKILSAITGEAVVATTTLAGTIAAVALPATVIIGTIIALGVALKALYDEYNKDAIAAEKAAESAKYANEKFAEAQNNYKTLSSDFSGYKEAKKALDDLTVGTDEWNASLQSVNDQVLDLLDKYPDLAKYVSMTRKGEMVISEEGLDAVQKAQKDAIDQARLAKIASSAASDRAARKSAATDTQRKVSWSDQKETEDSEEGDPEQLSADDLNILANLVNTQGSDSLKDTETLVTALGVKEDDPMIAAIQRNITTITGYVESANQLEVSESAKLQAICGDILNKIPGENKVDKPEEDFAAELFTAEEDKALKTLQEQDRDTVAKRFAKEVLGSETAYANRQFKQGSNLFGESGDDTFTLNGTDYRLDYMEQQLAAIDAKKAIESDTGSLTQLSENIDQSVAGKITMTRGSNSLSSSIFSGNNLTGSDKKDFSFQGIDLNQAQALYSGMLQQKNNSQLAQYLGLDKLTPEQLSAKGYETAEEYAVAYKEKLQKELNAGEHGYDTATQLKWLANSQNLNQFDANITEMKESGVNVSRDTEAQGLENLASKYSNTTDEITNYKEALKKLKEAEESGDEASIESAQANFKEEESMLRLATKAGELAKQYDLSSKEIEDYAKTLQENSEYEELSGEELAEMAKDQKRYDRALQNSTDHIEDWIDAINEANKKGKKLSKDTLGDLQDAYGDLLDIDGSQLSDSFLQNVENAELLQKAIGGEEEAYNQLMKNAQTDMEQGFKVKVDLDSTDFYEKKAIVEANLANWDGHEIKMGASVDDDKFLQALSDMVNAAGMTADEATDYLSSMSVDAQVESDTQDIQENVATNLVPTTGVTTVPYVVPASSPDGLPTIAQASFPSVTYTTEPVMQTKKVTGTGLKVTSATKTSGGGVKFTNRSGGGGGGGGGSKKAAKPKKAEKGKWDPFKPIENKISRLTAKQDVLSEYDDELYGSKKVKNLEKLKKSYEEYLKLKQQEVDLAKEQIEIQKNQAEDEYGNKTIRGYADMVGIELQYDIDGNIINAKDIYDAFVAAYNDAVDTYNEHKDDEDTTEFDDALSDAKDNMDKAKEAWENYQDLLDKQEGYEKEIREGVDNIQDTNDKIFDTLSDMLNEWINAIKDSREFNQKVFEFLNNGANLSTRFTPAIESASGTIKDLIGVTAKMTDWNGKTKTFSNITEDDVKKMLGLDKQVSRDKLLDSALEQSGANQIYNQLGPREDPNVDWSTIGGGDIGPVFDKGNFHTMVDLLKEGKKDEAQALYDAAVKSILTANPDRDKEYVLRDFAGYNDFVDAVMRAIGSVAAQEKDNAEYKSASYSSPQLIALQQLEEAQKQMQEAIAKQGTDEYSEVTAQAAYDNLKDAMDRVQTVSESIIDSFESLNEVISDAIDTAEDIISRRFDSYDRLIDSIDSLSEQISLFYGEKGYDYQLSANDLAVSAYNGQLDALSSGINYWQSIVDKLEETKQANIHWSQENEEALQDAKNKITDLQSEQMDTEQSLLEKISERLEIQANKAANEFANSLLGGDVDWMQSQWEMRQRNEEAHLDDMNKAYNIQKLQFSYQKMLNDAAQKNTGIQQQISAQMNDQLDYLREKDKLTQADIDYANAQLSVLEKQIALQDAQSAKTKMRLQRDASGNYSYVYTADESDVAQKQQDLLDAQINAYNIAKQALLDSENNTISEITNARDKIIEIWTDANLDAEERKARIQEVMASLGEYSAGQSENIKTYSLEILQQVAQSTETISNENAESLTGIYKQMQTDSTETINEIDSRFQLFANDTNTKIGEVTTKMTDLAGQVKQSTTGVLDEYNKYSGDLLNALENSLTDYSTKMKETLDTIYGDLGGNANISSQQVKAIEASIFSLQSKINNLSFESPKFEADLISLKKSIDEVCIEITSEMAKAAQEIVKQLQTQFNKASTIVNNLNNEFKTLSQTANDALNSVSGLDKMPGEIKNYASGRVWSSDKDLASLSNYEWAEAIAGSIVNAGNYSSYGNDDDDPDYENRLAGVASAEWWGNYSGFVDLVRYFIKMNNWKHDTDYYTRFKKYDSGGYTGSWNGGIDEKEGRLAILHQKELVLNATDTKNLLDIVSQVRQMQNILGNNITDYSKLFAANGGDTIEQRVEIKADFPNVTSSIEIENALLNIADMAYQSAHRNY